MNHIALTIGPIYKTLANAKKPKELFSSSYIFSYIMKNIIEEFRDRTFVTPYIEDNSIFEESNKLGLFHDRFIFQSQDGDVKKLQNIIDDVLTQIAIKLDIEVQTVKEYLQLHYFEKDVKVNAILELSPYLDTQELFVQTSQTSDSFIKAIKSKDIFLDKSDGFISKLSKLSYNKYFCVVHADGDNMSKAIANPADIHRVSKNLFDYCVQSNKLISNFGGQTIFAGGDDLLFFAPVISKDATKTIFNLCNDISNYFDTKFKDATLSFGVSIQYVKYPLYEAIENSRDLLFNKAKKNQKNSIAFHVTKHSGQSFETLIHKGNKEVYDNFLVFSSNINGGDDMDNFLHSIHHKIASYKKTIDLIGTDTQKLQNFFNNYFNEAIHQQYRSFFEALIDFIVAVYQAQDIKNDEKLNVIYATLRFIKFVQGDKA